MQIIGSGFIRYNPITFTDSTLKLPLVSHVPVTQVNDKFERQSNHYSVIDNKMAFGASKFKNLPIVVEYPPTPSWAVSIERDTIPGVGAGFILRHSNGRELFVKHDMDTSTAPQPPALPPWAVGLTVFTHHPDSPHEPCYKFTNSQGAVLWVPLSHNADTAMLGQPNTHARIHLPSAYASSSSSVKPKTRPNPNLN